MRYWTPEEEETCRTLAETHSDSEIGEILGRSFNSVKVKRLHLGIIRPRDVWRCSGFTPEDDQRLMEWAGELDCAAIARLLGRSRSGVRARLEMLQGAGVPIRRTRRCREWTDEEEETLLHDARHEPLAKVAARLGRTLTACRVHMQRLTGGLQQHILPPGYRFSREVAAIFGVPIGTVGDWVEQGAIRGIRIGMNRSKYDDWAFSEAEIETVVRRGPHLYAITAMSVGRWKRLALAVRASSDRLLSYEEAARIKGCAVSTLRQAIQRGDLRAERRLGTRYQVVIRRGDLDQWEVDRGMQRISRIQHAGKRRAA